MNFEQLTTDAKLAGLLATATDCITVDNGSANLDSTFLHLERGQRVKPFVDALARAGLCAVPMNWLGRGLLISPPTTGQANRRHAANHALYESLQRSGWPVTPFYQMD